MLPPTLSLAIIYHSRGQHLPDILASGTSWNSWRARGIHCRQKLTSHAAGLSDGLRKRVRDGLQNRTAAFLRMKMGTLRGEVVWSMLEALFQSRLPRSHSLVGARDFQERIRETRYTKTIVDQSTTFGVFPQLQPTYRKAKTKKKSINTASSAILFIDVFFLVWKTSCE